MTRPRTTKLPRTQGEAGMTHDHLWRVEDVAEFLNVSRRAVYLLPGLPRVELPGRGERPIIRYVPDEVRAWARNRSTRRKGKVAA